MLITEGYLPFGPYRTYYRIVGKESAQHPPLLLLHGILKSFAHLINKYVLDKTVP